MNAQQELVAEFHRAFDHPVASKPTWPDDSMMDLRIRLVLEELDELEEALINRDVVAVADALGDLAYVVYGMALVLGYELGCACMEIESSGASFPLKSIAKSGFREVRDRVRLMQASARRKEHYSLKCKLEDIIVAIYAMADHFGIPIVAVFEEIHRSNMSKLGANGKPVKREDGKIMKGPNYLPPNLPRVMRFATTGDTGGVL